MRLFVKTTLPKKPKTKESEKIAYAYAVLLVIIALCQLFTFDEFIFLVGDFGLPGADPITRLISGVVVVSEIFALPFLLNMRLSPLMRIVSMSFSWLVPLIWFVLSLWLMLTINAVSNIGFLGTIVNITPGWWAIFVCMAVGIMAFWSSWGMWPSERRK